MTPTPIQTCTPIIENRPWTDQEIAERVFEVFVLGNADRNLSPLHGCLYSGLTDGGNGYGCAVGCLLMPDDAMALDAYGGNYTADLMPERNEDVYLRYFKGINMYFLREIQRWHDHEIIERGQQERRGSFLKLLSSYSYLDLSPLVEAKIEDD